ncbi:MAG: hypothetical protein UY99_C0011G0009 [Parcubacteria group bacterium GW2011_GWA1_59_11]|nr:MAG: hypothetical protein UY99_C0011G0009 [Parcubacteria group bacterium GW2011_GWA1_59_11]
MLKSKKTLLELTAKEETVAAAHEPGSDGEKQLIQAAKNGDLEAFEKLLYAYERPIYSYVYRNCTNTST